MKSASNLLILFILLIISVPAFSQKWAEMMKDPKANFYDIQKEFNAYWSLPENKKVLDNQLANRKKNNKDINQTDKNNTDKPKKAAGWKQFKRWEWMIEPRVYPSGNLMPPNDYFLSLEKKLTEPTRQGNWSFIGVSNTPSNVYPYSGVGRVNCIRFDPSNSSIVYAGTPSGGLWKSTDGGNNWTLWNTDALASLGVSDVAIDPQNSQIMYIASGDRDADATIGVGVLKSTDGGLTWNTTGLNWNVAQGNVSNRILIDPTNTQVIHVATSNGIYKSTDGGVTFTMVSSVSTRDMEFKPGDPTTIYACSNTGIYRSTNSGVSYSLMYTLNGAGGIAMAVTEANSNYVYALATDANTNGYKGLYRSTDSGNSFTLMSSTPNILGYECTGSDNAGQGWYNLAIAASPTDANAIYIGGIFIWSSTDGGATWSIKGSYAGCSPYVFPDVHDLIFLPGSGSTIYAGCDGGVFQTFDDGGSWTGTNNGLEIAQEYTIGQSASNGSLILTSCQDVGTDLLNGSTWTRLESGEATEVIIDRTNNNTFYGGGYSGQYKMRSDDGGSTWVDIMTGITGNGAWVTPWIQDVSNASTLWTGYQEIFKSTNKGANWVQMSSLGSTESFIAIDQAPSNNQVVYAARSTSIIKTVNGGTSWTTITGNLPVSNAQIKYIEVDPVDANHLWVTFSGYSVTDKVWVSYNGGTTWSNYSTGLPNLPANCIVYQNNSAFGTLYVGMDVGVYFRDSTMGAWSSFSGGLPNAVVSELEIQYTVGKIRAATYGRGMWESNFINTTMQNLDASAISVLEPATSTCASSVAPIIKIRNVGINTITTLSLKYKMDSQNIQTYSWTGSLATMATANITLPIYNLTAGAHTLTVYTSNPNNLTDQNNLNDTIVYTFTNLAITNALQAPVVEGFTPSTFPPTNWQMVNTHSLWSHATNTGGYGLTSECAKASFFDVSSGTDMLITPHLDFQNLTAPIRLYFDVAYTSYNTNTADSLVLELYDECDNTTSRIYAKGGSALSTAPNITSPFTPSPTQWRTDTVNLDTMAGKPPVKVRFLAISNYGNNLYLDNVNLNGTSLAVTSMENASNILVYPNPSKGLFTVTAGKLAVEKIEVYNTLGDKIQNLEKIQDNSTIDISNQPNGVYLIHIISKDNRVVKKVTLSK
jgi:hypothetical protein